MFNIFKKKTPKWEQLSDQQKKAVTSKLMKTVKAMAGARYKVVSGVDQFQRERGVTETLDEDRILTAYRRGRMLDLTRNAMRNSPTFNGILKQLDLNAIGTQGGKVIFRYGDDRADAVRSEFRKWTREADFFDGLNFNTLLKLILKTYVSGGDCVILFDDGLVEDSGKLMIFEPDEIGNVDAESVRRHFGANAVQSLGRVYNPNGRFIGVTVSRSQRGLDTFSADKCFFLKRDPDGCQLDSSWMMPRNVFRVGQGRGVSPMSSSLATIVDLEDLCGFELAAAKANAQTFASITQESQQQQDADMPSAFDTDTDFSGMTEEEIEEAVKQEQESQEQVVTLDKAQAAGVVYQVLPENYKMELLDTKHPNDIMPEFVRWLATRSAAPFGLTEQFATLKAEGANFRAQQLMSQPAFVECQKFLEQICDWALYRWATWATKRGKIDVSALGEDWMRYVDWCWPKLDELDQQAYQNAWQMKLKNGTGSYQEYYGSDWREKLTQIKDEIEWFKRNGMAHPSFEMISGGERTGAETIETEEETE